MDVLLAATCLLLFAPLLVVIGILIRVSLGSPVLFRQPRAGLKGRPFTMVKFRTMRDLRDGDGELLPNEARTTRVGEFLRSTSLDELPELWNVLGGQMSLVGPRPLLLDYLPLYTARQARRHEVLPGITGWAQIHGRNATTWSKRLELDVWYVDNRSLWLDFRILCLTLLRVVRRQGVHHRGRTTMERFRGTTQ